MDDVDAMVTSIRMMSRIEVWRGGMMMMMGKEV